MPGAKTTCGPVTRTEGAARTEYIRADLVAEKDAEIERLRKLVIHYADMAGVPEAEVRQRCQL